MLAPNRIRFGGIFSNELNMPDLIMDCAFDSDNSEVNTFLTREAVASESYDGRNRRISSFKYTENFSPKFTFLKKGFGDFTQDEIRALLKYLTSKDTTGLLEVYDDDSNVISWASIGNFSEIQLYKIANKRVVGITAVWDSISPFCLSDLHTVTKAISSPSDNKITINIDTDDNKPVYPRIIIKHNGLVVRIPDGTVYTEMSDMVPYTVYYNGTMYYWKTPESTDGVYFHSDTTNPNLATTSVKFTNTHTDFFNQKKVLPSVIVKNNNSTEQVVLDGANKIVSSSSVRRIFGDDFNQQWLELYDGKNEITVEGNCEVTLSWREARKVGEY
jgi:hypothetical protein